MAQTSLEPLHRDPDVRTGLAVALVALGRLVPTDYFWADIALVICAALLLWSAHRLRQRRTEHTAGSAIDSRSHKSAWLNLLSGMALGFAIALRFLDSPVAHARDWSSASLVIGLMLAVLAQRERRAEGLEPTRGFAR